jgi:hypothetical protein
MRGVVYGTWIVQKVKTDFVWTSRCDIFYESDSTYFRHKHLDSSTCDTIRLYCTSITSLLGHKIFFAE